MFGDVLVSVVGKKEKREKRKLSMKQMCPNLSKLLHFYLENWLCYLYVYNIVLIPFIPFHSVLSFTQRG